jgi:hypothetical protein
MHYATIHKKRRRQRAREYVYSYLATHFCVDCGENDPIVLEFDHVRGVKTCSVSDLLGKSAGLAKVQEEVGKCVVRCANCHRRKTARDGGWTRAINP